MTINRATRGDNRLKDAVADVSGRFVAANPLSHERWKNACEVMPGGNTRTVLHYEPFPVAMVRGEGACLTDMDGHRYTDFLGEYSAGLYGHSDAVIRDALVDAIDGGIVLGAPNRWEGLLAEQVCARFPSMDKVRFTNSGTEANLMALGAARAFTGRNRIMVAEGGYHGGVLYFPEGGVSALNAPFDSVYSPYNDTDGTLAVLHANRDDLAAVILEPMIGSGGCIPADAGYLRAVREFTAAHGIVLIFDEVMTSRSAPGGLQQRLGVIPDMTTLGKYLGGGAGFGAFGGREELMARFDPTRTGALRHAGTFNNNVMSMAAGYAGLTRVFSDDRADELFRMGEGLKADLNARIQSNNIDMQITGVGSILGVHFTAAPVNCPGDVVNNPEKQQLVHLEMMLRGFTYAQRGYMSLSLPMTAADCTAFCEAFESVIVNHAGVLGR